MSGSQTEGVDVKGALLQLMEDNPEAVEALEKAIEVEREGGAGPPWKDGWDYANVNTSPQTLKQLLQEGFISREKQKTSQATTYSVDDPEQVEEAIEALRGSDGEEEESDEGMDKGEIPDNLFDVIIGHEPVKNLLWRAIETDSQTHFRMQGESSTAKSVFLTELERLPGCHYRSAAGMTSSGLMEFLITHEPDMILLDELDKAEAEVYTPLLELSEHGRVQKTHGDQEITVYMDTDIVCTLNHPEKLTEELRARLVKLRFEEYDEEEFLEVVTGVLQQKEGVPEEVAEYIAEIQLDTMDDRNVREAIQIARLCGDTTESVDMVVESILEYR